MIKNINLAAYNIFIVRRWYNFILTIPDGFMLILETLKVLLIYYL